MIVTRRGFLASCIALTAAPAIVRANSLMRVVPRRALYAGLAQRYGWTYVTTGFGALHGYERVNEPGLPTDHAETDGLVLVKVPQDAEFDLGTPDKAAFDLLQKIHRAKCPPANQLLSSHDIFSKHIYMPGGGWAVNPHYIRSPV